MIAGWSKCRHLDGICSIVLYRMGHSDTQIRVLNGIFNCFYEGMINDVGKNLSMRFGGFWASVGLVVYIIECIMKCWLWDEQVEKFKIRVFFEIENEDFMDLRVV